eukprot:8349290-Heterocapsa_arctica.AAC.1
MCQFCKENEEDEIHRWYICGCHNSFRKDFEHVRLQAVKELSDREATHPSTKTPRREHLWLRGLPQVIDVDNPKGVDASPETK